MKKKFFEKKSEFKCDRILKPSAHLAIYTKHIIYNVFHFCFCCQI